MTIDHETTKAIEKHLRILGYHYPSVEWDGALAAARAYAARSTADEAFPITIRREDAQRIFDLAVGADSACSGYMDLDDVKAMRQLAVALGVDPAVCTGSEFTTQFPHTYEPGHPNIDEHRQTITIQRGNVTIRQPETTEQVLARLGGAVPKVCMAGRWQGRCGKAADDPIHTPEGDSPQP